MVSPAIVLATEGHPGMPEAFHGTASGTVGAQIEARIGGMVVASTSVEAGQIYGYAPHLFFIPDPSGTRSGSLISFTIAGVPVSQTATFANGAIVELALGIASTTASSTNTSTGGGTSDTTSASSANSTTANTSGASATVTNASVTTTTANTQSPAQPLPHQTNRYDLNGDGRVDLLDFNLLVAHWGTAGKGTSADIDGDGTVGLLDFNLLLSHWSV